MWWVLDASVGLSVYVAVLLGTLVQPRVLIQGEHDGPQSIRTGGVHRLLVWVGHCKAGIYSLLILPDGTLAVRRHFRQEL